MTLDELNYGQIGVVSGYSPESAAFRRKLLAFGLTPGTEVKVIRKAPLGDPIEVQLRGFFLSLRKVEASLICVELSSSCAACNGKNCCG